MALLKMYSLFKNGFFHCHVSLPEGKRIIATLEYLGALDRGSFLRNSCSVEPSKSIGNDSSPSARSGMSWMETNAVLHIFSITSLSLSSVGDAWDHNPLCSATSCNSGDLDMSVLSAAFVSSIDWTTPLNRSMESFTQFELAGIAAVICNEFNAQDEDTAVKCALSCNKSACDYGNWEDFRTVSEYTRSVCVKPMSPLGRISVITKYK